MSLIGLFEWLATTQGSIALHESLYAYAIVESLHVLTLCVFVGLAAILDFRLLGWVLTGVPASELIDRLLPWIKAGFVVMIITGVLLFYAIPVRSYQNIFFRVKVILLVLAGLNAWTFHATIYRQIAQWDLAAVTPRRAKLAGAASLTLWALIIVAGRMIAYNWFDCDGPQSAFIVWAAGCTASTMTMP